MTSVLRTFVLLVAVLPLAGLLWLGQAALARANSITVTSSTDTDTDDGLCTLREAITNANNNNTSGSIDCASGGGSTDIITFAGDYTITLSSALPHLSSLTIDGSGQSVTINGNNSVRGFRLQSDSQVTLTNLNLIHGSGDREGGGAILVETGATLTLIKAALSNNIIGDRDQLDSGLGGGLINSGTVTISNSTISNNRAGSLGFNTGYGGGIYNIGALTLISTTLSGNTANGGGIFPYGYGGGAYNIGTLTLINSVVISNGAIGHPGPYIGGGIGGGILNNNGTLIIMNSTLSGNYTRGSKYIAGSGGGIHNTGVLMITNSTLSNNQANRDVITGGGGGSGGGINNSGILTMTNTTLSNNIGGAGGGLANSSMLYFSNSLIANSVGGPDCVNTANVISANLNNLVEDGSCSQNGVKFRKGDPRLSLLQDNGGPTLTHIPLPGSPVLNAGDNGSAAGLAFDQRGPGFPRILDGVVDIGAVEGVGSNGLLYLPIVRKAFK